MMELLFTAQIYDIMCYGFVINNVARAKGVVYLLGFGDE